MANADGSTAPFRCFPPALIVPSALSVLPWQPTQVGFADREMAVDRRRVTVTTVALRPRGIGRPLVRCGAMAIDVAAVAVAPVQVGSVPPPAAMSSVPVAKTTSGGDKVS